MIEGAIVNMDVYIIYAGLVKAIAAGNIEETLKQGMYDFCDKLILIR